MIKVFLRAAAISIAVATIIFVLSSCSSAKKNTDKSLETSESSVSSKEISTENKSSVDGTLNNSDTSSDIPENSTDKALTDENKDKTSDVGDNDNIQSTDSYTHPSKDDVTVNITTGEDQLPFI